jgi:hypothetical protein
LVSDPAEIAALEANPAVMPTAHFIRKSVTEMPAQPGGDQIPHK